VSLHLQSTGFLCIHCDLVLQQVTRIIVTRTKQRTCSKLKQRGWDHTVRAKTSCKSTPTATRLTARLAQLVVEMFKVQTLLRRLHMAASLERGTYARATPSRHHIPAASIQTTTRYVRYGEVSGRSVWPAALARNLPIFYFFFNSHSIASH
jgi:hypothetical protein